jgi:dihydroorotase
MALWESIKDGTVDMVATDHAPHTLEEKKREYVDAPSGVPGVQTMLPLLLNAVNEDKLKLEKVVELTSYNPARRFGVSNKGEIAEGMDADLVVVDMDRIDKVDKKYLFSKCGWSPFEGWELTGWPVMTFAGGNLMYEWREKFGQALGREVEYVK